MAAKDLGGSDRRATLIKGTNHSARKTMADEDFAKAKRLGFNAPRQSSSSARTRLLRVASSNFTLLIS